MAQGAQGSRPRGRWAFQPLLPGRPETLPTLLKLSSPKPQASPPFWENRGLWHKYLPFYLKIHFYLCLTRKCCFPR